MRTRERRPTVFVMAATGYGPAGSFRRRLAAALRTAGSNPTVRLTRPHTTEGIEREVARTRRQFAAQMPEGYDFPEGLRHFTTIAEIALDAVISGGTESAFAVVVLVSAAYAREQPNSGHVEHPARFFLRKERPDALIPVLIEGPAPSARSRDLGMRLLAAVPAEDWRKGPTQDKFAMLAARIAQVLETPFPAEGRPHARGFQEVVRVDASGAGDCFRISEGLALVAVGGRVEVAPGTYMETPQIARSVHLIGVGPRESIRVSGLSTKVQFQRRYPMMKRPQVIRATVQNLSFEPLTRVAGDKPTLWLNGGHLRFRDCSISAPANSAAISDFGNAGEDELRGPATFERCVIQAGASGATFVSRGPFRFRNCVFLGTGAPGQIGLAEYYSAKGRVSGCTFVDLDWPIYVQSAGEIDVRNSTINGGSAAIHLGCSAVGRLSGTVVRDALWGIQVADDAQLVFSKCRIAGARAGGIVVKGSARAVGWDIVVRETDGAGIWAAGHAELLLLASRLEQNKWGAFAQDSSSVEVAGSRFLKNTHYAIGGAGMALLVARANRISHQNIGVQFTEAASGEVTETSIRKSSEYSVGVWSSGKISIRRNVFEARVFVAPGSGSVEGDSESGAY